MGKRLEVRSVVLNFPLFTPVLFSCSPLSAFHFDKVFCFPFIPLFPLVFVCFLVCFSSLLFHYFLFCFPVHIFPDFFGVFFFFSSSIAPVFSLSLPTLSYLCFLSTIFFSMIVRFLFIFCSFCWCFFLTHIVSLFGSQSHLVFNIFTLAVIFLSSSIFLCTFVTLCCCCAFS